MKINQKIYDYGNNIETSDLCADIGYVLILPFQASQANYPKNVKTVPYIVTFTDETITMKSIMKEYKSMNKAIENKRLEFSLPNGESIQDEATIRDIRLRMGGVNINGFNLFTTELIIAKNKQKMAQEEYEIDQYDDQCAIQTYLNKNQGFGSQYLKLLIQIERKDTINEVVSVCVHGEVIFNSLAIKIIEQMKKQFGLQLDLSDILDIINKQTKKPLDRKTVLIQQKVYNKHILILRLSSLKIKLKRLRSKDYNSYITIFKEGEKDPKKFKYSQISEMTFSQLYNTHLQHQDSKLRKDLKYGLKITDMIIKPDEKISMAEIYFKNQNKEPITVVAKVINEKMVFYHTIPALVKKGEEFIIDKHISIPKNQEESRRNFRQISKARAQKTKNQYFKRLQRLEPILIYTSELRYYQDNQKKQARIYESLNRFLRDTPIFSLEEEKLRKQWRYLYSSTLINNLQNIQKFKGLTYRGISYDPKAEKGKIITFKQFISTSVSRQTARTFAAQGNNPMKHMFQLDIIEGYPIKQYSVYQKEEEILLEPFTDFQVLGIRQLKEEVNGKAFDFRIYSLKQLKTEKKLPDIRTNFLVWIDDKPKEGLKLYSKLELQETTMLIQLISTQDLSEWLKRNQFLFQDRFANFIFITNMTRNEKGKINELAGIEGLREIRKWCPFADVFFYIGNVELANKKMEDNKVDKTDVFVGCSSKELKEFLNKSINEKK